MILLQINVIQSLVYRVVYVCFSGIGKNNSHFNNYTLM